MTAIPSKPLRLGVVVGGNRTGYSASHEVTYGLDMLDLDGDPTAPASAARIALPFLAHGLTVNPRSPQEGVVFEKRGTGAASVDLASRVLLRVLEPVPAHAFYGHGAFTADAAALLVVETELSTNAGLVSVRDPRTFAVVDCFPTYGEAPHDCCLVDGGKTLALTNGGGKAGGAAACVTFVDVATQALVDRYEVAAPTLNTGHIAFAGDREFVVVSAPRDGLPPDTSLGGVSIRRPGGSLAYVREPAAVASRMVGESLSVCIHEPSRTALTTHPYGNLVTFWNIDRGVLLAALDVPYPRGATLTRDGSRFVVSFGTTGGLVLFETAPLRLANGPLPGIGRFGGSHIYSWERG